MNWEKYNQLKEEHYHRFVHTLHECGEFLLHASDEEIAYYIFEEFDIDARSDLYIDHLDFLVSEGFIDDKIKEKCTELLKLFCDIQPNQPELWNVASVRSSPVWLKLMVLSDEIKEMLYY